MGTFHNDKGELHGITVVVDTPGPLVYVGRCDEMDAQRVILLDVDQHNEGEGGKSKQDYLSKVARFGAWKKHDRLVLPLTEVKSVQRLSEYAKAQPKPAPALAIPAPATPVAATAKPEASASSADKLVELTPSAQTEVTRLIHEDGRAGVGLRLGVKGGGCSGLSYKLEFDTKKEGDLSVDYSGFNIFLDRKSAVYLRGIKLDHQKGLQGRGFVFHNPNATNTCGCGESFSV